MEKISLNIGFQLAFQCPYNKFSLSIIAGSYFYSKPRGKSVSYFEVEIGLLHNDKLVYLKENAKFFSHDTEGYTDWDRFKQIVEYVNTLDEDLIDKKYGGN